MNVPFTFGNIFKSSKKLYFKLIIIFAILCLVSCGGSSENPKSYLDLGSGSGDSFRSGEVSSTLSVNQALSYGGSTSLTVTIVDASNNSLITGQNVRVNFSSDCLDLGQSSMDTRVITSTGTAVSTYTAISCLGSDTIRAELDDGTLASANIIIAQPELGSIQFVESTEFSIALAGFGTNSMLETTELSFILRDSSGQIIPGYEVGFSLSSSLGGISLSVPSTITDENGLASVTLSSGFIVTSVNVIAYVESDQSPSISTTSNSISIVGALPTQDGFQITTTVYNPRSWDFNGTRSEVMVRASDRNNMLSTNGSKVHFVTNAGNITGSCILNSGLCSVEWTSQNPRPQNGIIKILAYVIGEESFSDLNANGLFDPEEPILNDFSEAFLDVNENDHHDIGEFFLDFNQDTFHSDKEDNTIFQGNGCSETALAEGHCENLFHVRSTVTLCMSSDEVVVTDNRNQIVDLGAGENTIEVNLSDANGLSPAKGTLVSVTSENVEIVAGGEIDVINQCSTGGQTNSITIVGKDATADNNPNTSGVIMVEVTQVNGLVNTHIISVID